MYIVGGMPEAVDAYIKTQSFAEVRAVHREILEGYERDISKHAPMNVLHLEVKAEENVRSQSLKAYREKFSPARAFRASMKGYIVQEGLINMPLCAVHAMGQI